MSTAKKTKRIFNTSVPKPKPKVPAVPAYDQVKIKPAKEVMLVNPKLAQSKPKSLAKAIKKGKNNKTLKVDTPPPPQGGNPPYDRDKVIQKLNEAFSIGCTDLEACNYAGISKSTLYNIQNEVEDFLEQKEIAKAKPVLVARKTIFESLTTVEGARWFMPRKMSSEFGDKSSLLVQDAQGALTEERKAEIAMAMKNWSDPENGDELEEDYTTVEQIDQGEDNEDR